MNSIVSKVAATFKKVMRNRALYGVIGVWAFFWVLVLFMDPLDLRRTMDAARFGTATVALWVTAAVAALAVWEGVRDRGGLVAISWALIFGTISFQSLYIPVSREMPYLIPESMQGQLIPSAIGYSYALSAIVFIFAVASGRGTADSFTRASWMFLFVALSLAGVVGGVAVGLMIGLGITGSLL